MIRGGVSNLQQLGASVYSRDTVPKKTVFYLYHSLVPFALATPSLLVNNGQRRFSPRQVYRHKQHKVIDWPKIIVQLAHEWELVSQRGQSQQALGARHLFLSHVSPSPSSLSLTATLLRLSLLLAYRHHRLTSSRLSNLAGAPMPDGALRLESCCCRSSRMPWTALRSLVHTPPLPSKPAFVLLPRLFTCLPAHLPTNLPTYLHTYLSVYPNSSGST
ncbi:hypothetical protein F5B20DRAFT_320636 [Whalleya microplaca]|nr:hypothetical protein F5B20DRAFT_320636 [Whalleya microplaca]